MIRRHDNVVHTLIKYIRKVGGTVTHEPRNLDSRTQNIVDVDVCIDYQRFSIDVQVVNPTATSNIIQSKVSIGSAMMAEKQKASHHSFLDILFLHNRNNSHTLLSHTSSNN